VRVWNSEDVFANSEVCVSEQSARDLSRRVGRQTELNLEEQYCTQQSVCLSVCKTGRATTRTSGCHTFERPADIHVHTLCGPIEKWRLQG